MRHLDLFSGIGGFALAAQTVWGDDYENVAFCDIEPFSQAVLKKHWPNAHIHDDIKTLEGKGLGPIDLLTGGFPCQPFSAAGLRKGKEDDRHLWPEMLRIIRETSPRWIIGENVGGLLTWNGGMVLDEVFADLEAEGYEVWAYVIPAAGVGAPHRRDRVWIVAHTKGLGGGRSAGEERGEIERLLFAGQSQGSEIWSEGEERAGLGADSNGAGERGQGKRISIRQRRSQPATPDAHGNGRAVTHAGDERLQGLGREGSRHSGLGDREGSKEGSAWREDWPEAAARLCPVDDGVPRGLVRPKGWRNAALKAAGNAIVPQVAMMIMRGIKEADLIGQENRGVSLK